MKHWHALILIGLLVSALVLPSCDLLGIGGTKEEDYYKQQLELMQKQAEMNQQAQEQYNEAIRKSLQDYLNQYNSYTQAQQQQQLQSMEQALKDKEQDIPYN